MAEPPVGSATVRAPATSANLGPGFDAFGLALDLHDEVTVAVDGIGELTNTVVRGKRAMAWLAARRSLRG